MRHATKATTLMEYRYKIAYNVCLLAALLLIYNSINTAFGDGISGKTPDVAVHIVVFFIVMALILAAIYCRYKDMGLKK